TGSPAAAAGDRALEPARHPKHGPKRAPEPHHHLLDAGVGQHRRPGPDGAGHPLRGRFLPFALVLLGLVVMIGTLTQLRVVNASNQDLAQVIGMNRLRAAYLELDPAIERYLVTSAHDDHRGLWQTYRPLIGGPPTQPSASSVSLIVFV